jgi:hypothetical protein
LTAAISSASASTFGVAPSGSVKFYDGATFIGTVTLNSSGVATISYSFTQEGNHGLSAVYSGNTAFLPSQSSSQLIVVNPSPTTTTVTANYNPQGLGAPVTFSATVSAGSGATAFPSGVATFYDGANTLGTVTLDATGTAKFTISTLALGQHPITASFASSTVYFLPSISSAYAENIVVAIGDFSISASSASQALYTGEATKSVTITLTSSGSWDQNVILACSQPDVRTWRKRRFPACHSNHGTPPSYLNCIGGKLTLAAQDWVSDCGPGADLHSLQTAIFPATAYFRSVQSRGFVRRDERMWNSYRRRRNTSRCL